jgi:O-antigen/teichoic acid export membrane protein
MLIGAPPTFGYYAVALALPGLVLSLFYGAASPYASLTLAVQILVVAWAMGYVADMTCSYLHGVDAARLALIINALGAVAAVLLALALTRMYGLTGGCLSLVGANLVRLAAAHYIQTRIIADERPA